MEQLALLTVDHTSLTLLSGGPDVLLDGPQMDLIMIELEEPADIENLGVHYLVFLLDSINPLDILTPIPSSIGSAS